MGLQRLKRTLTTMVTTVVAVRLSSLHKDLNSLLSHRHRRQRRNRERLQITSRPTRVHARPTLPYTGLWVSVQ